MKTNNEPVASGNWTNAPNMVYLDHCMRSDFLDAVTIGHPGNIEYIRTDVLYSWIAEEAKRIAAEEATWVSNGQLLELDRFAHLINRTKLKQLHESKRM